MCSIAPGHLFRLFLVLLMLPAIAGAQRPELPQDIPLIDAAWDNPAENFTFVILGDKTSGGEGKWPIYDEAVKTINNLDPDFVITIGDMIPGHMEDRAAWDAEWAEYMDHAQHIDPPLFFTVGNHDIANLACHRFWQEDFGKTYYSFDYKGCHFLILNTEEERVDGRGPVWQEMIRWAEADLAASTGARHTYVLFHKAMWDDPRYLADWAIIEQALGNRPRTVVAGHEHYHSYEKRHDHDYIICSAVGGGINLSEVKKWGGFHSFGHVTVANATSTYAVVEPDGTRWPVDVAPASFRKAITHEIVQVDAPAGQELDADSAGIRNVLSVRNTLDKPVSVDISFSGLEQSCWKRSDGQQPSDFTLRVPTLSPGETYTDRLDWQVSQQALSFPPAVGWSVSYAGHEIHKETMRMVEVNTLPIHPVQSYRAPERIQLVGPFPLSNFDPTQLPDAPEKASPDLVRRIGPETGYHPKQAYEGGLRWKAHNTAGFGLINANALVGTLDHAACYVACSVYAPSPRLTHAIVGSDNFDQTYLNGELIKQAQGFDSPGGYVYPPLNLKKGWNDLVVKLINNRGDWYLRLLIADEKGDLLLRATRNAN